MGPKFGGGIKCPRCVKTVYAAEEVKAIGQSWHKMCFRCVTCNKMLDSTNCTDKDNQIYCKSCYGKQFGPKGYGYGLGAGVLQMHTTPAEGPSTGDSVEPEQDTVVASATNVDVMEDNEVPAAEEPKVESVQEDTDVAVTSTPPSIPTTASKPSSSSTVSADSDMCPRCKKRVYFAEKLIGAGRTWHKACFRCAGCGKLLDSFASEKDGEFYCKGCYAKTYGPKGFGHAGTLQYTE